MSRVPFFFMGLDCLLERVVMIIICSDCRKILGEKEPLDDKRHTHSFCRPCYLKFAGEHAIPRLGELLDKFDVPVMVVNEEFRTLAVNQKLADILGKSDRECHGLLGGEALECKFSKFELECGKTTHCAACVIRGAVQETLDTGMPQTDVPATLEQDNAEVQILISSKMDSEIQGVVVQIKPC
jgi:transcriptional regulator with PAS, ATPase and Fis domain